MDQNEKLFRPLGICIQNYIEKMNLSGSDKKLFRRLGICIQNYIEKLIYMDQI